MRWTATLSGAGLLLAGMVGVAPAQSYYRPIPTTATRSTGTSYSPPIAAPGCNTPSMPSYGTPAPSYGTPAPSYGTPSTGSSVAPYSPGTLPSTPGASSAPGSMAAPSGTGAMSPGAIPPGAGAAAGAAAAAAAADPAGAGVGERGGDTLASAAPQMIGDLGGYGAALTRHRASSSGPRSPVVARSGIKISENESPRPIDRFFLTYNYFNGMNTFGGQSFGLHRGVIGFEKTFLDGNASIGMRLPFLQGDQRGVGNVDGFGDLSVILKYAFYNDLETGDLASGGVVVTAPTGISPILADGSELNGVLVQPWLGGIINIDDIFAQGFTALIIPTQGNDLTLYTLDVGVGYRLYQGEYDDFLRAVIPTLEAHLNVPFSSSGPSDLIYFPDSLFMTGGVHFGLGRQGWLTLAGAVPVTGPKLYDAEFIAQFNFRF